MSWSKENTDMNGPVKLQSKDGKVKITPIPKKPYEPAAKIKVVETITTEEVPGTIGHIEKNIPSGKPILSAAYDVVRDSVNPGRFNRIFRVKTKE